MDFKFSATAPEIESPEASVVFSDLETIEDVDLLLEALTTRFTAKGVCALVHTGLNYRVTPKIRKGIRDGHTAMVEAGEEEIDIPAVEKKLDEFYLTWTPGVIKREKKSLLKKAEEQVEAMTEQDQMKHLIVNLSNMGDEELADTYRAKYQDKFDEAPGV